MRERLRVEIEWLIALSSLGLPELPPMAEPLKAELRQLVVQFSIETARRSRRSRPRRTTTSKAGRVLHQGAQPGRRSQAAELHPLREARPRTTTRVDR